MAIPTKRRSITSLSLAARRDLELGKEKPNHSFVSHFVFEDALDWIDMLLENAASAQNRADGDAEYYSWYHS